MADAAGGSTVLTLALFGRKYYLAGIWEVPEPTDSALFEGDELFVLGSILFSVAAFVSVRPRADLPRSHAKATSERSPPRLVARADVVGLSTSAISPRPRARLCWQ